MYVCMYISNIKRPKRKKFFFSFGQKTKTQTKEKQKKKTGMHRVNQFKFFFGGFVH